jgi:hypothetical protein
MKDATTVIGFLARKEAKIAKLVFLAALLLCVLARQMVLGPRAKSD